MKLLKGFLAIVLISVIAVSCKSEKKDAAETTTDEVIVVDGTAAEKAVVIEGEVAEHKCDENCKEGNCPHHAKDGAKKCAVSKCGEADCAGENCVKCAAKKAECKLKCAAKKAAADVEEGAKKVDAAVKDALN